MTEQETKLFNTYANALVKLQLEPDQLRKIGEAAMKEYKTKGRGSFVCPFTSLDSMRRHTMIAGHSSKFVYLTQAQLLGAECEAVITSVKEYDPTNTFLITFCCNNRFMCHHFKVTK